MMIKMDTEATYIVIFLTVLLASVSANCPASMGCDFEPANPVKCGANYECVYDNQCLADSAAFTEDDCCAAPLPAACPSLLDPQFCGSKSCPYDNLCIAQLAGYTPDQCHPAPLWSDEFRGDTLNQDYWSYDVGGGGWGNFELQTYTPGSVAVTDGNLEITASSNGAGAGWFSGRIKSIDKVSFKYGRAEAMINVPDVADGLWPAFWTMGANFETVGWPAAGELDIMEIGQGLAITEGVVNNRVIGGAHWDFYGTYATHADWETFDFWLNSTWHNYTLDWTPYYVTTYIDGNEVFKMRVEQGLASEEKCEDCDEFHQPHFFLLNLAVGGGFTSTGGDGSSSSGGSSGSSGCGSSSAGSSSGSSGGCGPRTNITAPLPAVMKVDYLRVYDNGFTEVFFPTPVTTPPTAPPTQGPQATSPPTTMPTPMPTSPTATPPPTNIPTMQPTPIPTAIETPRPTPAPVPDFLTDPLPTPDPTSPPTRRPSRSPSSAPSFRPSEGKGKGKGGKGSSNSNDEGQRTSELDDIALANRLNNAANSSANDYSCYIVGISALVSGILLLVL